jgi:hypothetical protein
VENPLKDLRYKLVLGKYPVTRVDRTAFEVSFILNLQGAQIKIDVPPNTDVREGDILTLYTEVLCHRSTN